MLLLNTFGPAFGEVDASPFCMKAMCLLTMAGLEWENRPGQDGRNTPYGRLPVLVDDGKKIADSDRIRFHLEARYNAEFDASLSSEQRAQSRALIRLAEEHLYFCLVYDRWVDDHSWAEVRSVFFSNFPPILRNVIPTLVRRAVIRSIKAQGMGQYDYGVMLERARLDISAIEKTLIGNQFLFGSQASAADASVGPLLNAIAAHPLETQLKHEVVSRKRLVNYMDAVRETIYPK